MASNRRNGGQGLAGLALSVALIALVLTALVSQAGVGNNAQRALEGAEAHDGLCALKDNIERHRVIDLASLESSQRFLRANPNGIPGISADVIRASIDAKQLGIRNQDATLKALKRTVNCD